VCEGGYVLVRQGFNDCAMRGCVRWFEKFPDGVYRNFSEKITNSFLGIRYAEKPESGNVQKKDYIREI